MKNPAKQTTLSDEAIEERAAAWLVQQDDGFSPEQAAEFARWRSADPRHAAAVAMLEETCGILGRMPALRTELGGSAGGSPASEKSGRAARAPKGKIVSFPASLKLVAAIAACLTVAAAVWWSRPDRDAFTQTYTTGATGGLQRVVLPDESVIELNAVTEVRVHYSKSARGITLARGEAHFTVTKNPTRPFLVGAGNVAVRAVGTAFNVRLEKAAVEVIVTEGRVQVSQTANSPAMSLTTSVTTAPTLLDAGQRVVVPMENAHGLMSPVASLDATAVREVLAWRASRLVFVDTPLSEVVQQFNRHNRVQLAIGDDELGKRAVGGNFRADHVETFVRLLQDSRDIAVERPDADRIVLRRVAPAR